MFATIAMAVLESRMIPFARPLNYGVPTLSGMVLLLSQNKDLRFLRHGQLFAMRTDSIDMSTTW